MPFPMLQRFKSLAALSILLAGALASAAAPVAVPGDLARVADHLHMVDTMTADFVQTDRDGKALAGVLTLKKPGRIRFQYEKGVPILVVGDGKSLIFIDYSVKQVQRWPIGNSPLGVLLDPARDLGRIAHVVPSIDSRFVSIDAADPRHPEYGRITLVFSRVGGAPAGLVLQGWTTLDPQNNRTSVRLTHQRFNVPVADTMFRWNDPRPTGAHR